MSFSTDNGGLALPLSDVKLINDFAQTWNTRLSQIERMKKVIICTYSLPNLNYVFRILDKRSDNVVIIMNSKFEDVANKLRVRYPALRVITRRDVHAKLVLAEPQTVWLSSANFGSSGWFECTIGIHNKVAYEFYMEQLSRYLKGR